MSFEWKTKIKDSYKNFKGVKNYATRDAPILQAKFLEK